MTNIMERLSEHFAFDEISWRVVNVFDYRGAKRGFIAPFVSSRTIQDRLDEVFGIDAWQVSYERWSEKAVKCRLSVLIDGKWIYKEDGSEETDFNAVKGGFSSSFKRAAVLFGIGRYLYNAENVIVDLTTDRRNPNDIYTKYQSQGYYFTAPSCLKLKSDKQQSQSGNHTSNAKPNLQSMIQEIRNLVEPLGIKSRDILLAYNYNQNAQARKFEDTTTGGLEGIINSLQLIHEAKNISNANEKQLNRWLSTYIQGDITTFKQWLLFDYTEAIHQLITKLKNQQSA
ncbi:MULTISPECIES: Rad52/Rad22 family DNA repair protein [unclassified Bacillus (in: firmicutes)]|uniref:Rad52/Rad22 family DNA repair protein n=1 Tax=unclassified Bacillus (in: firmicutes) TaxID=185979 RepID=UPI000BF50535|nr:MULTISPECIES: Rad52/Rad22 family DNA repair protein [unclassified Bacillus (in: firmicutes)]PEU18139.1 hypothetical protein CN525_13045 [Bacillus sp. AFS014408]PFW62408.1 hypothetical protein COL20_13255 [Bacillus sp. AFS075034]